MTRLGRPPAMTTDERRDIVFAAAEELFRVRGFEQVSMNDIAAAAGMSKRTLYVLFADKQQLLTELVASSDIWPTGVLEATSKDAVEDLRARLRVIAEHVLSRRHVGLCRLAIAESLDVPGLSETFLDHAIGRSRASLIETVERIERKRRLVDLPSTVIADLLFGAACGNALLEALLTDEPPDVPRARRVADEVVASLFRPARR